MGVGGGDQASEVSGARAEGPWSSLRPTANRIAGRDPVRAEQRLSARSARKISSERRHCRRGRRNFQAVRCRHARSAKRRVCSA